MKRFLVVLPVAALALATACSETANAPTALAPDAPLKDNIYNNLDASIDAVAEVMALNAGGLAGTTTLYVDPTNGDGKNGCNLTGSTTLTLSVSSSNPSVATVSPSSVTFTTCGDTKQLTVTPLAVGSTSISVTQTSNTTEGTFTLAPATFTVNVAPGAPSNTAPAVSITGVTAGASYDVGSVPTATCEVVDAEDGNSSFAATLSAVTGPYSADGIGSQEASCSYTDNGGLPVSASLTYSIVDPSAPTIGYVLSPTAPDGSNGWYLGNVSLKWNVDEPQSPSSLAETGCDDQTVTADQAATAYSCSATSAGGSTGPVEVTIKRDATKPSISGAALPVPNANGWNHGDVTVSWTCNDATSGIATCPAATTVTGEGASLSAGPVSAVDNAGNSESASVTGIKIDRTKPEVSLVGGPADGGSYYFGSVPAAPTCSASDVLSGLDGSCSVSGYDATVGTHVVTATATDRAGNSQTATSSYTVLAWTIKGFYAPVDGNGVYNTVKGGSTVPLKFNVYAGSTEITATSAMTFAVTKFTCNSNALEDAVELTTTGGTSFRYDATAGQFIQNWQTPKLAGICYRVTMTAADGTPISALFKTK